MSFLSASFACRGQAPQPVQASFTPSVGLLFFACAPLSLPLSRCNCSFHSPQNACACGIYSARAGRPNSCRRSGTRVARRLQRCRLTRSSPQSVHTPACGLTKNQPTDRSIDRLINLSLCRDKGHHARPEGLGGDDSILNCCMFFTQGIDAPRKVRVRPENSDGRRAV